MSTKGFSPELCNLSETQRKLRWCRAQLAFIDKHGDLTSPDQRERYNELKERERILMFVCGGEVAEQAAAPDAADLAACQRDMDETNYRLAAEEDANPQGRVS